MFKNASGNWTDFRKLEPTPVEINFHVEGDDSAKPPYYEIMQDNAKTTIDALRTAQANGDGYVLFIHGSSTSHRGKTTTRSVVRGIMRSPDATPYILRSKCIQHYSVFLAAIRANVINP